MHLLIVHLTYMHTHFALQDVLFAVLVACNQLITYIKPKEHNLLPLG